jgi:anaerobic dimethyl sulfoxide reductase subunit A
MSIQEATVTDPGVKIVRANSLFDCGGRCPLRLHVKDDVIIKVEGDDTAEPEYQLRACVRCRAYKHYVHHKDRILHPMKRVGPKGKGEFEEISWDEALDTVAEKIRETNDQHGPGSIFFLAGGGYHGNLHGPGQIGKLLAMLGGFTTDYGNISSEGAVWAVMSTYGDVMVGHSREDFLNSKLILIWGWDPARMISGTNTMYHLIKAKEAGVKIISIGPRYDDTTAALECEWIPIRPGTDAAMMAAMANVIIKENLQDQAFLDKYAEGFDKYKDYVLGDEDGIEKTPEWAEEITGVPAARLEALAKEYATTDPACLMDCQGPARSAMGEQYNRSAITLTAMTGNIGKKGGSAAGGLMGIPMGHMFRSPGIPGMKNPVEEGAPSIRGTLDLNLRVVRRVHKVKVSDCLLEGKAGGYPADIKMVWSVTNNFVNQYGNANKASRALKQVDFMVCNEMFMTPTAKHADIIFPVTTAAEKSDISRPWPSGNYFMYSNQAIKPMGECKSDLEIAYLMAERMGFNDFKQFDEDEWLKLFHENNENLATYIPDWDQYKKDGVVRVELDEPIIAFKKEIEDPENNPFKTPSGKIEIFSQRAADLNDPMIPPIPKYLSTPEDRFDPSYEKYPLQVLSPHGRNRVHSTLTNVEELKEVEPHRVWMNPIDADPRGIKTDDDLHIFNDRGKIAIKAWVTERIVPGVLCIYQGTWYDPDDDGIDQGGCANTLTNDAYSGGGAAILNTVLVEATKA